MDNEKLDKIVAEANKAREQRDQGYREQALKMYPHICGRCAREFTRQNLQELTVHHRNHDHDYNPPDGSNWELLCIYCHDNEHRRYLDHLEGGGAEARDETKETLTHNPFGNLKDLLKQET